jgi:hypothetical protein
MTDIRPGKQIMAKDIQRIAMMAMRENLRNDTYGLRNVADGQMLDLIALNGFLSSPPTITMQGRNDTGADLEAYEVAAISGQPNTDYLEERSLELTLEAFDSDNLDLLAIAEEPIADGESGSVAVQGVWWVKCSGAQESFATPVSGGQAMVMATDGPAQVLFYDEPEGIAMVRFGAGSAGGGGGTVNWQFVRNEGSG